MPLAPPADFSWSIIHGPCSVYIAYGGSYLYLGITESGAKMLINPLEESIMNDVAGPQCEADVQDMGETAMITARLTALSYVTIEAMMRIRKGLAPGVNAGQAAARRGAPLAASGRTYGVSITSPVKPYNFLTCRLVSPFQFDMATKASSYDFTWKAWSPPKIDSGGNTSLADLYNNAQVP